MPLELDNRTPYTAQAIPMMALNGATFLSIVVKARYAISAQGELALSQEQPPVHMSDVFHGEPALSSVRYDSDVIHLKPMTELLVLGHAWTPGGKRATQSEVRLYWGGELLKRLRVFGDRFWVRGLMGWTMTAPDPFEHMPIIYERAYGGSDEFGSECRNRVGTGYATKRRPDFEGTKVANIEDPDHLISRVGDAPAPAGLGVVGRSFEPRLGFAGTYDDAWLKERHPLLPLDFDMRFHQSAPQDQWVPRPKGGEVVRIEGMSPDAPLVFSLPVETVGLALRYDDRAERKDMVLDTVLVETEERWLTLTWRSAADIHGDPFRLREMLIGRGGEKFLVNLCER